MVCKSVCSIPSGTSKKLKLVAQSGTVLPAKLIALFGGILQHVLPTYAIITNYIYWSYTDTAHKNVETRVILDSMVSELLLAKTCFKRKKFFAPTVLKKEDWKNLRPPILFMVGENEFIYSSHKAALYLNEIAPQIKSLIIPNTGHGLMILESERISNEILGFSDDSTAEGRDKHTVIYI